MQKVFITALLFAVATNVLALDTPVLSAPSNNIVKAYTKQTFSWGKVSSAAYYQLQIDTTSDFNSPLLRDETYSASSSTYFSATVRNLYFNSHYYWRVRSMSSDKSVTSEWSSVWRFTTLSKPTLVSPNDEDAQAGYYPTQSLRWKNSYGTSAYLYEIDTVPTFDSPAKTCEKRSLSNDKDAQIYYTVSNLYLGCFNYWRLKLYNANDSSDWSETYRFHTLSRAKAKTPDGLTSAYTEQTLRWEYYNGLNNAIIELDTTAQFDSPIKATYQTTGSNQDNCYQSVNNLLFGTTYYWRVCTYHKKDTTDWSKVLSFTTYNFCTLSTPADSSIYRYTSGKVYWRYSKGISKYQVQLDTVPTFDSPVLTNVIESASSDEYAYYSYSQLYFGQWYYWRVRECHAKDTSAWSETRHFKTYRHCNLNTTPYDSAVEVSTSPDLYFTYSNGVSYYQQQIDTTPNFNSPLCETKIETGSSSTSYNYHTFYNLRFGTRYFRRVRECLPKDTSDWSPIRSFTTIVKGAYSTSYSIAKGATDQSINPLLYYAYRNYIDSVEIQLDTAPDFNSPLLEIHRVKQASSQSYAYIEPYKSLLYGTTYYWRVRNIHSKDISDWTTPRYFTTVTKLAQPQLISPANSTQVSSETLVTFLWDNISDAQSYIFQVAEDEAFATIRHQETLTTNSTTLVLTIPNTTYYWRVQAVNDMGSSAWSETWAVTSYGDIPTALKSDAHQYDHVASKVLRDGNLLIIRDGKTYNAQGIVVEVVAKPR